MRDRRREARSAVTLDLADASRAALRVALLGPPHLTVPAGQLAIPRRQTRALLYYLAATAAPVPRDRLCFLFWPDAPESDARRNLTHLLTLLRRALPTPDLMTATEEHVGLDRRQVWSDTGAYEHLASIGEPAARTEALQRAVALWRGPFLDGVALPGCEEFEAWVVEERARWEHRYLATLARAIEDATAASGYPAAIDLVHRYLAVDELAEEMHRRLMLLQAATGDRAAALRQFARCAEVLQRELGVVPLPETLAARDDILAGDSPLGRHAEPPFLPTGEPAADAGGGGLPVPPDALIGRDADVAATVATILNPEVRLVTLTGPGGVGKTRLALAGAAVAAPAFADGAVFVPLAPLQDPALVPGAIAHALGLRETGDRPLLAGLTAVLRDRQMLLVLDNFEHVAPAATVVATLLAAAPRLTVLVTSRTLVRLSGEHAVVVPPLALPDLAALPPVDRLAEAGAVALLVARVRAHDPGFALTPANAADVAVICARLDGLPLALELAAARLRVLTPAQLLARLDRRLALLTEGPRDLPDRQRTLRATLDWSFALLDVGDRHLLARMAIFAGGWTLEAAEAVGLAPGPLIGGVLGGLQHLVDGHLVQPVAGSGGSRRFALLETVREYARERLALGGEEPAARRAHAAFFLAFAEQAAPALHGPDQIAWLDRLDEELPNLRAALEWLLAAGDATGAARLAGALGWYWARRGRQAEGRAWLARALTSADQIDSAVDGLPPRVEALARLAAGLLAVDQGELDPGTGHLQRSATLWQGIVDEGDADLADRRSLFRSLAFLAQVYGMRGDPAFGPMVPKLLALADSVGDPRVEAEMAFNYGRGLLHEGDLAAAKPRLQQAAVAFRDLGDPWVLAQVRIDLGMLALEDGDTAAAHDHFAAALAAARAFRDPAFEAVARVNLGETARMAGDDGASAAHYDAALCLYRRLGSRTEIPRVLHNLGYVALHAGDRELASARFRESLTGFEDVGLRRGTAEAAAGLAAVAASTGTPEEAALAGRLWGAAAAVFEARERVWPADRAEWARYQERARAVLGRSDFAAAMQAGHALPLETAIAEVTAP
jgi:predicted ATPase/DNA-binding SARP family transcriptional activator